MITKKLLFFLTILIFSCKRNNTSSQSEVDSALLHINANSLYAHKKFPDAIILFNKLIKLDSSNGEYFYKRGYSYSMLFNVEQAVIDYNKAIELGYREGDAYYNIGINYSTINDTLAILYLKRSIEINPKNEKAKVLLSECINRVAKH